MKVVVGKEEMEFVTGAFSYYGVPALQTALSLVHNQVTEGKLYCYRPHALMVIGWDCCYWYSSGTIVVNFLCNFIYQISAVLSKVIPILPKSAQYFLRNL